MPPRVCFSVVLLSANGTPSRRPLQVINYILLSYRKLCKFCLSANGTRGGRSKALPVEGEALRMSEEIQSLATAPREARRQYFRGASPTNGKRYFILLRRIVQILFYYHFPYGVYFSNIRFCVSLSNQGFQHIPCCRQQPKARAQSVLFVSNLF